MDTINTSTFTSTTTITTTPTRLSSGEQQGFREPGRALELQSDTHHALRVSEGCGRSPRFCHRFADEDRDLDRQQR